MRAEQAVSARGVDTARGLRTPGRRTDSLSCQYHVDTKDTEKPSRGRSGATLTHATFPSQVPGISPTILCKHCVCKEEGRGKEETEGEDPVSPLTHLR